MNQKLIRITAGSIAVILLIVVIPFALNSILGSSNKKQDLQIRLHMGNNNIQTLPLEEYIIGVVAAEMPAVFEPEALKAQAVAARTYALKRRNDSNTEGIFDVDTTEKTQVWISTQDMIKKWGIINYWKYHRKISKAVEETQGMVLTFKGQLIDAVYHSSSGRKDTERADEVWSSNAEYLVNVSSGEVDTLRYVKYITFDVSTFYKLLEFPKIPSQFSANDLLILERTKAGRVKSIAIKNRIFAGTDFRTKLRLPSTDFEWQVHGDKIELMVYGNGHGVGMSQYGANDLAKEGKSYKEILTHYYQGININRIN